LAKEKKLKTLEGAYVADVVKGSAAENAGIKAGDVINNVNGVAATTRTQVMEQIARYRPGDKITITVVRGNDEKEFKVELKNRQGNTEVVSSQTSDDVLGATYKAVNDKVKEQLRIENGIEVKSISKGKFADAGIKPGFIIVKINNQAIRSAEDVQSAYDAVINNGEQDKPFFITGIYPNGKVAYYAINLVDEK